MRKPTFSDGRILETARDHLRQLGAGRFTLVGVASELGMSHANIYRHFASKAALLEAVTASWLRPIETDLRAIAEGPDPARDKFERMATWLHRAYREKLVADPKLFAVFVDAARANAGVARKHRSRVRAEFKRVVEEILPSAACAEDVNAAVALAFDSTYRFLNPVCIRLDSDIPRENIAGRLDRLLDMVIAALVRQQ